MRQGIAEYQKRLGAYCRFEIIELEEYRLPDNPSRPKSPAAWRRRETVSSKKPPASFFPCDRGRDALLPRSWRSSFPPPPKKSGCLSFIIGGSFGLSPRVKAAAARKISFSPAYLSASAGPGAPLRAALPCLLHQCRCQVPQITTSSPELLQAPGFFLLQNVSRETFVRE